MYESKVISRKLLSAGLFRTAYGIDALRGEEDATYELFVFCAVLLERKGWDIDAILSGIDAKDYERAGWITNFVDRLVASPASKVPECIHLMDCLHELLSMQFPESEHYAMEQFCEDLCELAYVS